METAYELTVSILCLVFMLDAFLSYIWVMFSAGYMIEFYYLENEKRVMGI